MRLSVQHEKKNIEPGVPYSKNSIIFFRIYFAVHTLLSNSFAVKMCMLLCEALMAQQDFKIKALKQHCEAMLDNNNVFYTAESSCPCCCASHSIFDRTAANKDLIMKQQDIKIARLKT